MSDSVVTSSCVTCAENPEWAWGVASEGAAYNFVRKVCPTCHGTGVDRSDLIFAPESLVVALEDFGFRLGVNVSALSREDIDRAARALRITAWSYCHECEADTPDATCYEEEPHLHSWTKNGVFQREWTQRSGLLCLACGNWKCTFFDRPCIDTY